MPNHVHLIAVPPDRAGFAPGPSARPIVATRDGSTSARNGAALCGRGGSRRSSWANPISWPVYVWLELNRSYCQRAAAPRGNRNSAPLRLCARCGDPSTVALLLCAGRLPLGSCLVGPPRAKLRLSADPPVSLQGRPTPIDAGNPLPYSSSWTTIILCAVTARPVPAIRTMRSPESSSPAVRPQSVT